jgi:hypothetical protein
MSYDSDGVWRCKCPARGPATCGCKDIPVREALCARLAACGVRVDPMDWNLATDVLAALLVAVEDPYWAEGDSARLEDAMMMIHIVRKELAL